MRRDRIAGRGVVLEVTLVDGPAVISDDQVTESDACVRLRM
jgi:hypothetical protein